MKQKLSIITALLIHQVFLTGWSQTSSSVLPPSPNSAELGRYGDIPVGHSTGTINLSIPLATISTRNLTLPISLSYSSNGFRVNAIGSRAGFDWVLNGGGVITRSVFDEPEMAGGTQPVLTEPDFQTRDMALYQFLEQCNGGGWDNQPDIFHYNFNGYAGKFIFDKNGAVHHIPHSNIKVQYVGGAPENGFILTTIDGVRYHFGGVGATELSRFLPQSNCTVYQGLDDLIPTAWYLKKVEHPNGDYIDLHYSPATLEYRSSVTQTFYNNDLVRACALHAIDSLTNQPYVINCPEYEDIVCSTYIDSYTVLVKKIVTSGNDSIVFTYKPRKDVNGDALHNDIVFYNSFGDRIRKFKLDHDLITSENISSTNPDEKFRHFLVSVREYGIDDFLQKEHQFAYNDLASVPARFSTSQDNYGYFNGKSNIYHVEKPTNLMDRESFYKNGNYIGADKTPDANYSSRGLLKKVVYPTGAFSEITYEGHDSYITEDIQGSPEIKVITVAGDDNEPSVVEELQFTAPYDQPYLKRGVYAKFVNSTGVIDEDHHIRLEVSIINNTTGLTVLQEYVRLGEERFFGVGFVGGNHYTLRVDFYGFEGHSGLVNMIVYPAPQTVTHNKLIAGVRIQKVSSFEQPGAVPVVKKYYYRYLDNLHKSSGEIVAKPDVHVTTWHSAIAYSSPYALSVETCDCDYIILAGSSGGSTSRYSAPHHISYKSVLESSGENFENGGVEYVYSVEKDVGGFNELNGEIFNAPFTNKGYHNGALKMQNVFRWNGSSPAYVRKVEHFHKEDARINTTVKGFVVRKNFPIRGSNYALVPSQRAFIGAYDVASYFVHSRWNYIEKTVEKYFDEQGNETLSRTVNYHYDNPSHALVNRIETNDSKSNLVIQSKKYPHDVTASGTEETARLGLVNSYQIGQVVEEAMEKNGVVTITRNVFKEFATGKFLPQKVSSNTGAGYSMEDRVQFSLYDQRGNLLEISKEGDHKIAYIWGYNYSLPVAEITNASYQDVIDVLGQSVLDELNVDPGTDQAIRQRLQPLLNHAIFAKGQVRIYTYTPQVGVTSITDHNGNITTYEYDDFNRLKLVRDNDGNIVQSYEYQYKLN